VTEIDERLANNELHLTISYQEEGGKCPECGAMSPVYDHQHERTWRHMDTMQYECYLHSCTPRVKCDLHGVLNMRIPWAEKYSRFSLLLERHAIKVIKASRNIEEARKLLKMNWRQVQGIMSRAVERGMKNRKDDEIPWLGVDEKSFRKGQDYVSLAYDIDQRCVIDVVEGRDEKAARKLLNKALTPNQQEMVCGVAMDMSSTFISVVEDLLPNADIVHDRFHISQHLNDAVDQTRRQENKIMAAENDKRLTGTKYIWLKGMEHMSDENMARLEALKNMELKTAKAWALKEMFKHFWDRRNEDYARHYFDFWFKQVIESGLKQMKKVAAMLKKNLHNILSYFSSYITNALAEGMNSKIQAMKANARGFRSFENYRISILFFCGKLSMFP
jgi:transposase